MKTKILAALSLMIGILFMVFHDLNRFVPAFITKALIMPVIIAFFFLNMKNDKKPMHIFMFAGLFFSWTGDVLLEFSGNWPSMFIAGLAGFLLAHIMYLIVFFRSPGRNAVFNNRIYLLIPVIAYGLTFLYFLYDHLGDMKIPVLLYAVVMLAMLAGAVNRIEKVNRLSFLMVLMGAVLFVISDSLIAIGKFITPFAFSTMAVMITYIIAQLLITIGYIRQFRERLI